MDKNREIKTLFISGALVVGIFVLYLTGIAGITFVLISLGIVICLVLGIILNFFGKFKRSSPKPSESLSVDEKSPESKKKVFEVFPRGFYDSAPLLIEKSPDLEKLFAAPPVIQKKTKQNMKFWGKSASSLDKRKALVTGYLQHPDPEVRLKTLELTSRYNMLDYNDPLLFEVLATDPNEMVKQEAARIIWMAEGNAGCKYAVKKARNEIEFGSESDPVGPSRAWKALELLLESAPDEKARKALMNQIDASTRMEQEPDNTTEADPKGKTGPSLKSGIVGEDQGLKKVIPESSMENEPGRKSSSKKYKVFSLVATAIVMLVILGFFFMPRADISFAVEMIPERVEPGEEITITAEVHNSGNAEGSYILVLSVDDLEVEKQEIDVLPGGKEFVSFTISETLSPGNYQIALNDWLEEIKVLKPADFHIDDFNLAPGEIQTGQETTVSARIINKGEIAGSYLLELLLNGEPLLEKEINLAGNKSETFTFKFSKEEPGVHTVALNGHSKNLKVLKPADIRVSDLVISSSAVRPGQSVTVTVTACNSGDVSGEHTVSLAVGGRDEQSKTITVPGNSSEQVSFNITRDSPGHYRVTCEDESKTFTVMKIERPGNGSVLTRNMASGQGRLTIRNGRDQDALVVLTRANATEPLLAVYVRADSSTTIRNIADGTYDVYFTHGNYWDKFSNQFTANVSRMKFRDSLKYTTTRTHYRTYEITVHAVEGGTTPIDRVSPESFPTF